MGELMAFLSANPLTVKLAELISLSQRLRPIKVFTYPCALAKLIASGQATGRAQDPAGELKAALAKAMVDPAVKVQLKGDLDAKRLTTKNDALDGEIKTALG